MNSKIYNNSNKSIVTLIVLVLTTLTLSNCVLAKEKVTESLSETGSSKKYETKVDRKTEGELSDEDFRQVSLLTSQTLTHLNKAVEELLDNQADMASSELKNAQTLLGIIRELLPVTTVTTCWVTTTRTSGWRFPSNEGGRYSLRE